MTAGMLVLGVILGIAVGIGLAVKFVSDFFDNLKG